MPSSSSSADVPVLPPPPLQHQSSFLQSMSKVRAPTLRPLYNDTDSDIEWRLTEWVTEPILHHLIPRSVTPNSITFFNTATCWSLLCVAFLAWRLEASQPLTALLLRFLAAALVFVSMECDCLDGMQARRTGQSSLLGELLDHSLDAAHTCIFAACMLTILQPDFITACFSLVATGMVYNAQLVLYRRRKRMVNPPTNGPEAQLLLIAAVALFATFFFFVPRTSNAARAIVTLFSLGANVAQVNNIRFFYAQLRQDFVGADFFQGPHIQFAVTVFVLALLAYAGWMSVPVYWLAFICLSYRWNAHHLLYTILHKHVDTQDVKTRYERSEGSAHVDVWLWLLAVAVVNGLVLRSGDGWLSSAVPLAFSLYLLAWNLAELRAAIPVLERVQRERRRAKETAQAVATPPPKEEAPTPGSGASKTRR